MHISCIVYLPSTLLHSIKWMVRVYIINWDLLFKKINMNTTPIMTMS